MDQAARRAAAAQALLAGRNGVRAITFSPDGKSLAAAGRDHSGGSVTLWELK